MGLSSSSHSYLSAPRLLIRIAQHPVIGSLILPISLTRFEREAVERVDTQTGENLDAIFQLAIDSKEESVGRFLGALKGGGIGHSPMRGDRLPWP